MEVPLGEAQDEESNDFWVASWKVTSRTSADLDWVEFSNSTDPSDLRLLLKPPLTASGVSAVFKLTFADNHPRLPKESTFAVPIHVIDPQEASADIGDKYRS